MSSEQKKVDQNQRLKIKTLFISKIDVETRSIIDVEIVQRVISGDEDIFISSGKVIIQMRGNWYLHEMEIVLQVVPHEFFIIKALKTNVFLS